METYKEEIRRLYTEDKMSGFKIADKLGIKRDKVYSYLKEEGLTRSNRMNSRKYSANYDSFRIIDSEESAYWLGFMYADGYISNSRNNKGIGLSLSLKDLDHIYKFKSFLSSTNPINEYISSGYSNTKYGRLFISSDTLFDDLNSLGCLEKKSLILRFPDSNMVPAEYRHHFIRGYFDGDGSISISGNQYKFRVCGTSHFLNSVLEYIDKPNSVLQKRNKDLKDNWGIDIGGNLQVLKVLNIIYENSTIYMNRKHERYLDLKSRYCESNR